MKSVPRFRRRRYFLPNTSQPALLITAQIILLGLMLVTSVVFLLVANRDLTESYFAAHIAVRNVRDLLLPTLILVNLAGLLLGSLLLIFYTHRVAGPAYHLCRIMKKVSEGDLSQRVFFRKKDQLKELSAAANEMIEELNSRLRRMQQGVQELESQWQGLQSELPPTAAHKELATTIRRLKEEVEGFKLD